MRVIKLESLIMMLEKHGERERERERGNEPRMITVDIASQATKQSKLKLLQWQLQSLREVTAIVVSLFISVF